MPVYHSAAARNAISLLRRKWSKCNDCGLGCEATEHVFFRGELPCQVLYVGEAPGETEDLLGEPFVGKAGDTFNKFLDRVSREFKRTYSYAITNILCCFPRDSEGRPRPPVKEEAEACAPRLARFIKIADPLLVVTLGKIAEKYTPKLDLPTLAISHPSYWNRSGGVSSLEFARCRKRLLTFLRENF